MLMADLGADVVRIDRVSDLTGPPDDGRSVINRGKRSIVLDLKAPGATELTLSLLDQADVVIEAFRPGVTERLGLGPDVVLARNPTIVYARMTGWGQTGPKAQTAGHDLGYIAGTGLLHAIGPRRTPVIPLNLLGDYAGGAMYAVVGMLAALRHAERTGEGQVVDASIADGSIHLGTLIYAMHALGTWTDAREANLMDGAAPFYSIYETADGRHLTVAPIEPKFYEVFARLAALPGDRPGQYDRERWPELRDIIADQIRTKSLAEWTTIFAGTDACVEPVLTLTEAGVDGHAAARDTFITIDGVRQPAPTPRFSSSPGKVRHGAPEIGADTQAVLREWKVPGADEALASGLAVQRGARHAPAR
jgi:alpha-methylacyl-CoA racemase